jgi:hypothetical protein
MSPSATHPAYLPNRILRAPARMAVPAINVGRRTDAVASHRYSLAVVRELPVPPADRAGDSTW